MEPGEDFVDAAIRETLEETGLAVVPEKLINIFLGKNMEYLQAIFLAQDYKGSPVPSDENILDVRWISFDEVRHMGDQLIGPRTMNILIETYEKRNFSDIDLLHNWNMPDA